MATVREAKRIQVAATVADWLREDESVEVTGDDADVVRMGDAIANLHAWVVFTDRAPLPAETRTVARTEVSEQLVARGARWDGYAKVLRGVRLR